MSQPVPSPLAADQQLAGLKLTAEARESQLGARLVIAAVACLFLSTAYGPLYPAIGMAVLLVSQYVDLFLRRILLPPDRTRPMARWELVAVAALNLQASTVYGFVAGLAWFAQDNGFQVFAGFWLSGSMVHVIMHMHHDRLSFVTGFLPHVLWLVALSSSGLVFDVGLPAMVTISLLFAGSLFTAYAVRAYFAWEQRGKDLRQAQQIAEERRAAAEQASAAKSTFLATLSHEIRTPMNGILGMASALEEADLPDDARKQVRVLRQASDLLLVLLNDVLDMSKIEAGRIELEKNPFDLHEAVARVAQLHEAEAARKGLALRVSIAEGVPRRWIGDEHRIVQVLHNLTGNAVKFTAEGSVTLRLESAGAGVRLMVRDTGIGMTEEEQARVFEPFTQADSSTTRRFGGTGLGLTITHGLVEAMSGTLTVDSTKGEGTSFVIDLPLELHGEQPLPREEPLPMADIVLTGRRILAVDDNRVNLAVLDALLKREGAHVVLAASGQDALDLFAEGDFDLVLLDISMPHLDGPEVLRRMKAMRAAQDMPPVLAVSAHAMQGDIDRFLAEGFTGYVTKPVRLDALSRAAAQALGNDGRRHG